MKETDGAYRLACFALAGVQALELADEIDTAMTGARTEGISANQQLRIRDLADAIADNLDKAGVP